MMHSTSTVHGFGTNSACSTADVQELLPNLLKHGMIHTYTNTVQMTDLISFLGPY